MPGETARATRTRLGPRSAGVAMTADEFDATPDMAWVDGYRYELLGGVLVVSPPPAAGERRPNDVLGHLLRLHQDEHPGGPIDETLPEQTLRTTPDRRRCDRAIWVGIGRAFDPDTETPAIVVEFVSRSRRDVVRDYVTKRDAYGRLGVREYWVIDRFKRTMTVYRYGPDRAETVDETGTYRTDLIPGFGLELRLLLAHP